MICALFLLLSLAAGASLLRADPERAAQVRLWRADREALRAQLDATLHEPVPPRLAQAVMQDRTPRWRAAAMA